MAKTKATPTEKYWKKRQEELEKKWDKKSREEIEKELRAYYEQSLTHIEKDISALYQRFATDNGMDMAAAQQLLTGKEYRIWRMDIAEYVKEINATGNQELLRELNTLAMRSRITRLDALRAGTLKEMALLSEKSEAAMKKFLKSGYEDFYYHGLYEIGKKRGLEGAVSLVDGEKLERVLRVPWSGKNYSKRIWTNGAKLAKVIQQNIIAAAHRGVSVQEMTRDVRQRMGVGAKEAVRLVRTELNYVQNQAALHSIKDAGMKYYRFIATLDKRTSTLCQSHDGDVFPVEEAMPGKNMPPLHPHCRSVISGCLRDEHKPQSGTRIARDENGKNVFVPSYMKYDDWKDVFVDQKQSLESWTEKKVFAFKTERLEAAVNAAKTSVTLAESAFKSLPNDTYSGIWKEDVKLGDWEAKKASVPAKLKYFEEQIAAGNSVSKFEILTDELLEFDTFGKMYAERKAALQAAKEALNNAEDALYMHLNGGRRNPAKDPYTEKRRNNAFWFKQKSPADQRLRGDTGALWQKLSEEEREALYDYTCKSGKFNRPLAGFEKPYAASGSGWEEKYKKGVGKVWINYEGKGKKIRLMTEAISKSSYDFDIWLQRGCGNEAMDSFFGLKRGTFASLSPDELHGLVGHMESMDNFVSTAGCKGGGFGGQVILNIYAPKGTNMIYAEPFSHYGLGGKSKWNGKSDQKNFGNEFEVIIQRGAHYKATKIERRGGTTFIDLEIHPEMGYNLYQQDIAEWQGSRKNFNGKTVSIEEEKKGG